MGGPASAQMSGGSRAARGDLPLRQRPRAGNTSPAPTHTLRIVGAHTKFLILAHPPICMQVDGRRSSSHDQKLVMASSRRALGGRIFADVLGRCGAEASLNGGAPLRFKLIPNSLPQCPSSLPCAASLAHFSVARSSTEPYPPAPALCPAASNPSCLVSSQPRAVCLATIKPRARSARAASRFPMRARCAPVEAQASTGPRHRTLEPPRRRSPGI